MDIPKHVYKYRSISGDNFKKVQDIFVNKRIYVPKVSQLNDPFEGVFTMELEQKDNPWTNYAGDRYRETAKSMRVYSVSEINNTLMWSHYADNHSGICIEFSTTQLNSVFADLLKVNYSNTVPHIIRNQNGDELLRKGLLNKTIDWIYEKEWRLVARSKAFLSVENTITGVILGARISEGDLNWVKYWLKEYPSVRLYKCKNSSIKYQMEIYEL